MKPLFITLLTCLVIQAQTPFDQHRVISSAAAALRSQYVDRNLGNEMAQAIESTAAAGTYDSLTVPRDFADRVTQDLQKISHDQHVRIALPGGRGGAGGGQGNPGRGVFANVEMRPGNIGVLTLRSFARPDETTKQEVDEAFNKLAGARALIFDLRPSGGGSPDMVEYVCSYLFKDGSRVHLNDLYAAAIDERHESWTAPDLPGQRFPDVPVYILTAARTVSAAEGFAYDLQALKRAKVVGETTRGAANASIVVPIDGGFTITVPVAYVINPITKTSWENTGVIPDIPVAADEALDRALLDLNRGADHRTR
jgi:hypothetical protein